MTVTNYTVEAELRAGRVPGNVMTDRLAALPAQLKFAADSNDRDAPRIVRYGLYSDGYGLIAESERGICRLELRAGPQAIEELQADFPTAELRRDDKRARELAERLLQGGDYPVSVDLRGTPFQQQVWRALTRIPAGRCITYGQLATCLAMPGSARAVGGAVASNRIAVLVPCHRVVAAGGRLGDFRWGKELKLELLLAEQATAAQSLEDVA